MLPGVAVFEFLADNPTTIFCALPYELQFESAAGSDGSELVGHYMPQLQFTDPPFPSRAIAESLASSRNQISLLGVSPALFAFFRESDPVLVAAAKTARQPPEEVIGPPRSAAVSIPSLLAPPFQLQQQQQQQHSPGTEDVVLSTQPSTPVFGRMWPSPRHDPPLLRLPGPAELLDAASQTVSSSAPESESPIAQQHQHCFHQHHARHVSDGITALAVAAMDEDEMVDEDSFVAPAPALPSLVPASEQLPTRPFVITPGLRTPDLDEEVARVLLESAKRARELLLAASQPPSDTEEDGDTSSAKDTDGDYEMEDEDGEDEDGGDFIDGEFGSQHHHHHHHHHFHFNRRDGTPMGKAKRGSMNRGKVGALPTATDVPTCRWEGCNQTFATVAELTAHLQSHTATQVVHMCKWDGCVREGKPFTNHSGLFRHLRYHTGDKPCKCSVPGCGFSSVDNGELRRHLHLVHHLDVSGK